MRSGSKFYVYIVANTSKMLYVGLTNDIKSLLRKHQEKRMHIFRANFSLDILVYYEEIVSVGEALQREEKIKSLSRYEKYQLIEEKNPNWESLKLND